MRKLKYVKLFENFQINEDLDQYFPPVGSTSDDQRVLNGYHRTLLSDIIKKFEGTIQGEGGNIVEVGKDMSIPKFKYEKEFIQYSEETKMFFNQFQEKDRTAETELKAPIKFAESLRKGLEEFYGEKEIDYSDSKIKMKGVEESTDKEYIFKYILLEITKK